MIATNYRARKLGKQLKEGTARIQGRCSGGTYWPEKPHYWIIDDLNMAVTYHVLVSDRPGWKRYAPKF